MSLGNFLENIPRFFIQNRNQIVDLLHQNFVAFSKLLFSSIQFIKHYF